MILVGSRSRLRSIAAAVAALLVFATQVNAFTPPVGTHITSKCASPVAAGYIGRGAVNMKDEITYRDWDGRLQWQVCVVNDTGFRYAMVALSAPDDLYDFKLYTGEFTVYLERRVAASGSTPAYYQTIAQKWTHWEGVAGHVEPDPYAFDRATLSGGRWRFNTVSTGKSSLTGTCYRIEIVPNRSYVDQDLSEPVPGGHLTPYFRPCRSVTCGTARSTRRPA